MEFFEQTRLSDPGDAGDFHDRSTPGSGRLQAICENLWLQPRGR